MISASEARKIAKRHAENVAANVEQMIKDLGRGADVLQHEINSFLMNSGSLILMLGEVRRANREED